MVVVTSGFVLTGLKLCPGQTALTADCPGF